MSASGRKLLMQIEKASGPEARPIEHRKLNMEHNILDISEFQPLL